MAEMPRLQYHLRYSVWLIHDHIASDAPRALPHGILERLFTFPYMDAVVLL